MNEFRCCGCERGGMNDRNLKCVKGNYWEGDAENERKKNEERKNEAMKKRK